MDPEIIRKARNVDLISYLKSSGYEIFRSGAREYRLKEHDSLVISNNRWQWFSRDMGGNTLDFLMKYEGRSFRAAVEILSDKDTVIYDVTSNDRPLTFSAGSRQEATELILPVRAKDYHRVFAYLNRTRRIDAEIIKDMFHMGKLYQSDRGNYVFTGADREGNIRFACERGTFTGISYRCDCPGSDKRFCFHMEGRSDRLFVFEAPIDVLSHATLYKLKGTDYREDHRISLGCLGDRALMQYLNDRQGIEKIVLCLDNDRFGREASKRIMSKLIQAGYNATEEVPVKKDYNDELMDFVKLHGTWTTMKYRNEIQL